MELRQLQYFVTVAQHGSFTRAAQLLHLTQPGVSSQIRQLERELGHRLLDRSGRTVRLTPVGEAVLPHARAALASAAAAHRAAQEFGGLRRGHVRLGMVAGAALTPPSELGTFPGLATTLAAFRQEHPGIDFSLAEDTTARMLTALREGRLDLAVVGLPTPASGREGDDGWSALTGLALHTVLEIPLVAACAVGHPLVGGRSPGPASDPVPAPGPGPAAVPGPAPDPAPGPVNASGTASGPGPADGPAAPAPGWRALPVAALAGHALLSTPRGTGLRTALESALAEAGVEPAVGIEAAAPPQLAELAAHGLGVAVLPDPGPVPGLRVRPLTDPVPRVRIALAWSTGQPASPPTAALVAHLRQAYPGPAAAQPPAGTADPPVTGSTAAPSATCSSASAPSSTCRSSGK